MTDFMKITRMLLSILTVIFLFQLVFFDTSKIQLSIIEYIHQSSLSEPVSIISKLMAYVVLYFLYGVFFMNIFIFKPNIVDNAIFIIYYSSVYFLIPFLKLIIAELRPFMAASALKTHELKVYDCESSFAMPNDNILSYICLYYLFKVYYFEKQRHVLISEDINDEYEDENYLQNFFSFEKCDFILKPVAQIMGFNIPISLFNIVFLSLLLATGTFRFIAGSTFLSQLIFSGIIGFFWSHYFFVYLRGHIRQFVADIIVKPNNRMRATQYNIMMIYGLIICSCCLMFCREYFRNEKENDEFMKLVAQQCDHFYPIEEDSLKSSLIIVFPLVMLSLYNFNNIGQKLKDFENKNLVYSDLTLKQKVFRFLIYGSGLMIFFGVKTGIDYAVIWSTEGNYFNFHNIIIYIISMIILGVLVSVTFPLMAMKMGVLLQFEWIFLEDFQKLKTKKNPSEQTEMLVVYRDGEDKEEKLAEIQGKPYTKKKEKVKLTDMADAKPF